MLIAGLQKVTLIDYPGQVAATIFTLGCNFRCGFCHNPELVELDRKSPFLISEEEVFKFLKSRKGLLDGVCLTGGEPTLHQDCPAFIKKIKKLGFLVKLDTNGTNPQMLEKLISQRLIDYLAMDIKNSPEKYQETVGTKVNLKNIQKSIELIKNSGLDYQFRTTVVPGLIDEKEIKKIGQWIKGAKEFAVQQFQTTKTFDKSFEKVKPYSDEKLKELVEVIKPYVEEVKLQA
ncbi:MAG TPA: anaerobic ribonucleoside-triphosphate reductase activating protein [Candidatus Portnoybacteria bacterium]|nr:anaerobic ribonucleoside-triphosphate reductase activating protein [Candidatus Portnoybacteria bacterium]